MDQAQPDLFTPPSLVPGLRLAEGFLSIAEQTELVARFAHVTLAPFRFQRWEGKRLTASFGFSYDFERGRMVDAPPIPAWLDPVRERAAAFAGIDAATLRQALLIRYDPGAGIGWHRDRPQFDKVVGISLGGPVDLRLRRRTGAGFERRAVRLEPGSAYLLDGEVRHGWEHSIAPVARTRLSLTFRSVCAKLTGLDEMRA